MESSTKLEAVPLPAGHLSCFWKKMDLNRRIRLKNQRLIGCWVSNRRPPLKNISFWRMCTFGGVVGPFRIKGSSGAKTIGKTIFLPSSLICWIFPPKKAPLPSLWVPIVSIAQQRNLYQLSMALLGCFYLGLLADQVDQALPIFFLRKLQNDTWYHMDLMLQVWWFICTMWRCTHM